MIAPSTQSVTEPAMAPVRRTPRRRDALREQIRAVALSLRWPAALIAALIALLSILIGRDIAHGEVIDFHPEQFLLPALAGVLLPIAVWRDEDRFGPGFLWTLPVDRRWHALSRVAAGWVWLMAAIAAVVLWLLALALLSGDAILGPETLLYLPADPFPEIGTVDPATLRSVRWTPRAALWLVPFTSATVTYLFASAVTLGPRHPWRWVAGTVVALFLYLGVAEATGSRFLLDAPNAYVRPLILAPYGLDAALSARTEVLKVGTRLTTGEPAVVWRGFPDVGHWSGATLLWSAAGLLALWAAASRHRERRRPRATR